MKKLLTALSVISICSSAVASEMTFKFGSPSFSGNGKSSHYLTIENDGDPNLNVISDATALEHIEITDNAVNNFFIFSPLYTVIFIINIVYNAKKKRPKWPLFL